MSLMCLNCKWIKSVAFDSVKKYTQKSLSEGNLRLMQTEFKN